MPYKRKFNKRRPGQAAGKAKKAGKPRQYFKPRMGLSRSVIPFTREKETYCRLDTLAGLDDGAGTYLSMVRTNDGGVAGRVRIRLNNLPNSSEFTNLFKEYKLNYLKLTFYPAGNVAGTRVDERDGASPGNKNILIRTTLNRTNEVPDATDSIDHWSQIQAKKQWLLVQDRPTTITMKLNQLSKVQAGAVNGYSTHSVSKPQYISTNNADVNHYGITLRFDSLDGTAIDAANGDIWPKFRVVSKAYFTCKGVA